MFAVRTGDTQTAQLLIDNGAKVNHQDNIGNTALIIAAMGSNDATPMVKVLLNAGADINIQGEMGMTVLDWVQNQEIVTLLSKQQ